jgi:hypothetical protein
MTDNVIFGIDFKAKDRQSEIDRFALAVVGEALFPTDNELFEIEASNQSWPDSGDVA